MVFYFYTMITTVVFDLGGVLVDWKREYLYEKVFEDKIKMRWFLDNVCTWDWNEEQDGGKLQSVAVAEKIAEFPSWEKEIRMFYDRFDEMTQGGFPQTEKVLGELQQSKKYKLYALSNWSHETYPKTRNKFEFLNWFDGLVISGEEKLHKPNQAIYDALMNRFQVKGSEIIFIDDRQVNLDAAQNLGWKIILFTPELDLKAALNEQGVEY